MVKKDDTTPTIIQDGEPVLRAHAKPLEKEDFGTKKLHAILAEMTDALLKEPDGVAIAAPQIGVSLRIFIVAKSAFAIEDTHKQNTKCDIAHLDTESFRAYYHSGTPLGILKKKSRWLLPCGLINNTLAKH